MTAVNDTPYFSQPLPDQIVTDVDTFSLEFNIDQYVSDPDDPDSVLTWSYICRDSSYVDVQIDHETRIAHISGIVKTGEIHIVFTVTDPHDASVNDSLNISIIHTFVHNNQIGDAPKTYVLYNNYPNPFNPVTTIRYGIPKTDNVRLVIYNMLGQELATLIDEKQKPGIYEYQWDGTDFPSGIYFYHLKLSNWQKVDRMILAK
jgi:hypothetical protein